MARTLGQRSFDGDEERREPGFVESSDAELHARRDPQLKDGHGQRASRPTRIPAKGWWDIARRVSGRSGQEHMSLISAGVAFFAFLALFPGLIAVVSLYGFFTDAADRQVHLRALLGFVPTEVHDLLAEQLRNISSRETETLGVSAAVGLAVALWSANKGTRALFEGINIAYGETGRRGFFKQNALCLLFTLGFAGGLCLAFAVVVGFGAFGDRLQLSPLLTFSLGATGWLVIAVLLTIGLALVYKFAPVRTNPKLRWVSVGSVVALTLWLAASAAFSVYVANFGSYGETYGSLAAITIFLFWLYISALAVQLGAQINGEAEHQTIYDTTIGEYKPLGERGAWHADHVAVVNKSSARSGYDRREDPQHSTENSTAKDSRRAHES